MVLPNREEDRRAARLLATVRNTAQLRASAAMPVARRHLAGLSTLVKGGPVMGSGTHGTEMGSDGQNVLATYSSGST